MDGKQPTTTCPTNQPWQSSKFFATGWDLLPPIVESIGLLTPGTTPGTTPGSNTTYFSDNPISRPLSPEVSADSPGFSESRCHSCNDENETNTSSYTSEENEYGLESEADIADLIANARINSVIQFENDTEGPISIGYANPDSQSSIAGGSEGGTSYPNLPKSPPQKAQYTTGSRRKRRTSSEPEEEDDEADYPKKRNRQSKNNLSPLEERGGRRYACPYYKNDRMHPNHVGCATKHFPNIPKVKGHVLRSHLKPIQCTRCYRFRGGDYGQILRHLDQSDCPKSKKVPIDRDILEKTKQISSRTDCKSWEDIYVIIFRCLRSEVPNPFFHGTLEETLEFPQVSTVSEYQQSPMSSRTTAINQEQNNWASLFPTPDPSPTSELTITFDDVSKQNNASQECTGSDKVATSIEDTVASFWADPEIESFINFLRGP